jgi:hypothetical protein
VRVIQGLPKVSATLNIEPKIGAIAKHPSQYQGRRGCDGAVIIAQLIHMLTRHAHGFSECSLIKAKRLHKLLNQDFANASRPALCLDHVCLTDSYDCRDKARWPVPCRHPSGKSGAIIY